MKIMLGCDEAGLKMKQQIREGLGDNEALEIEDVGCYNEAPVLYPDIALQATRKIQAGSADRAILICGTGIGMAISANKIKGVRAAVCHDIFSTERSVLSNNTQVMCLGARVIAPQLALALVRRWLDLEFVDGSSSAKVQRISEIEGE